MSKTYEFVITCVGVGDDPDSAWEDAADYLSQAIEACVPVDKGKSGSWTAFCTYELESDDGDEG